VFTCRRCGASKAVTLPLESDVATVTCSACGAPQPRRDYEVERLAAQFQRALEKASAEVDTSSAPDHELVLCPACDSVLVAGESGCPRCGFGRKSFLARHAAVLPWVTFVGLAAAALGALFTVGRILRDGVVLNAALLFSGALLCAFGVRALGSPATLEIVDNQGVGALGNRRGENSRKSAGKGILVGATCLVLGVVLLVLGVFAGAL
jgi:hypothetical protein